MNNSLIICIAILLSACIGGGNHHTNNFYNCVDGASAEKCIVEKVTQACTRTADRYSYSRDRLLYQEYGQLFTDDARFQLEGQDAAQGRAAIVAALRARGPENKTLHVSQVVDMQVTDANTATSISTVVVWRFSDHQIGQPPSAAPWLFGEYHDRFQMVDGRCLIAERLVKITGQSNIDQ